MRPLSNFINSNIKLIGGLACSLLLISCGSYNNSSYNNDGIYAPNPNDSNYSAEETAQVSNRDNNTIKEIKSLLM